MNTLTAPHPFYLSTAAQSRRIDTDTIQKFGIDGYTLMEVAGSSAAKHLLNTIEAGARGLYFCGKGNNAGDALVIARYLVQYGIAATLVFISGTDNLSRDAAKNLSLLLKISDNDPGAAPVTLVENWSDFSQHLPADFIIDGMLGTGLTSDLRSDYASAAGWINRSKLPVYAVDIPTGLHADSGKVLGTAVQATETITFGMQKLGFYLSEGFSHTGSVIFCELPFPNYLKSECHTYLLDDSWVKPAPRQPARHKYETGVLYLIAGSEGLTGAAILAARSAWAEGLGAVVLICPRGILGTFEHSLPQIIKKPVGTREDFFFKPEHSEEALHIIREKPGKLLLGPGLGRNTDTVQFVESLANSFRGDMLIDADGLWCLAQLRDWNKPREAEWILTPHPGELSSLTGKSGADGETRLHHTREYARKNDITLLSKGFPSIVGTRQGKCYLTRYDTRKFARAGFGDVLAGKIAAYWLLGNDAAASCALGLLNGNKRIDLLIRGNPNHVAEPKDLI